MNASAESTDRALSDLDVWIRHGFAPGTAGRHSARDAERALEGVFGVLKDVKMPTGKPFAAPAGFLYEARDGRIARERRIHDFIGMLVQMGVLKAKPT